MQAIPSENRHDEYAEILNARVRYDLIRLLLENGRMSLVASTGLIVVVVGLFWTSQLRVALIGWAGYLLAVTAARLALLYAYRRQASVEADLEQWGKWFLVGAVATGLGWGAAGIWLYADESLTHQLVLAFALAGISAGAVVSLSPRPDIAVLFTLLSLTPFIGRLGVGGDFMHVSMGVMVGLYTAVLIWTARNYGAMLEMSIRQSRRSEFLQGAVRISEERFRTLFESSQDAIMTLAPPKWQFTSGNPATVRMFNTQDEAEFISFGPWELSPERQPDGRLSSDKAREMIETAMREGSHVFEWTHQRRTGEAFPATVLLTRIEIDGQPQLQATVRDISGQKQAEDALRNMNIELEARVYERTAALERAYQHLNFHVENTPLGVIQWAPDGKLLHWSAQAERIFGWTAREVEGKYPKEWPFIPEDERPAMQESMERLISGRERRKVQRVRHCGKNGQDVHCVWHTSLMVDESGQVVSIMALVQDLSEQVRLERQFHQAQKMEAVGRLAGGVAHDFNNLLTVINGYSDVMLTDQKTPDAIKKVFEQILRAGNRASSLTGQLLAFSRQQVVQPKTLSLNTTVAETEKMLQCLIGEDVRLTVGANAYPDIIKADPVQVEQIVMNLAVNARDAMPNGGRLSMETATVHLREPFLAQAGGTLAPGTYVTLIVRDSGSGIDEATLAKIFEPFFTTKGPGKGTGLGLATVHGIVQQSGGAITVSSRRGEGTTFVIYFPCVEDVKIVVPVPLPVGQTAKGGTETILLVEDEPTVRAFAQEVLSASGYTVLGVRTAEEAMFLSNGHESPIHLLITDIVLPLGRGTKLAEELRRKRPGMKILLMSGYVDQSLRADTEMITQLPFLQKPFTREIMLAKVREALDS